MRRGDDLAGYLPRIGAALLDGLVLVGLVVIVLTVTGGRPEESRELIVAGAVLVSLLYAPPLLARKGEHNGQTLGKQAVGIRVVRADAAPMSASSALLREFVGKGLLGLVPFFSIVDYLLPFADARRQAIHDKIASTFVVRADAVPDLPEEETETVGLSEDPFGADR
ncbi:MAG: RDD family protein [Solirubrobacterales bacterium]|nr:RDD family protein [Solirubrobacterales bacterium]